MSDETQTEREKNDEASPIVEQKSEKDLPKSYPRLIWDLNWDMKKIVNERSLYGYEVPNETTR